MGSVKGFLVTLRHGLLDVHAGAQKCQTWANFGLAGKADTHIVTHVPCITCVAGDTIHPSLIIAAQL